MDGENKMIKTILSLIYPRKCSFCKRVLTPDEDKWRICESCKRKLLFVEEKYLSFKKRNKLLEISNDYYFEDAVSPFYYEDPVSKLICDFKFHKKHILSNMFAGFMCEVFEKEYKDMKLDYITYIPMYRSKERKRGFNQAKLLAEQVSKATGIKIKDLLIKHVDNKAQHSLSLDLRAWNIKGVYKLSGKENIKDKTILLIDDIVTSGNTLSEAAKILKENGAEKVYCLTIAAAKVKNKDSLRRYLNNQKNIK